jgi:hypothetical protein
MSFKRIILHSNIGVGSVNLALLLAVNEIFNRQLNWPSRLSWYLDVCESSVNFFNLQKKQGIINTEYTHKVCGIYTYWQWSVFGWGFFTSWRRRRARPVSDIGAGFAANSFSFPQHSETSLWYCSGLKILETLKPIYGAFNRNIGGTHDDINCRFATYVSKLTKCFVSALKILAILAKKLISNLF